MDKCHCADVQCCFTHIRSARATGLQALRHHAQEDAQHRVEHGPIALHEVVQPLGYGQHPLAHRQAREHVIGQVL